MQSEATRPTIVFFMSVYVVSLSFSSSVDLVDDWGDQVELDTPDIDVLVCLSIDFFFSSFFVKFKKSWQQF